MGTIATLAALYNMMGKFLGIASGAGLPDEFYQRVIDDPEFRRELVGWAKLKLTPKPKLVVEPEKNPFEMTVEDQIKALRVANEEEGWGITEEVFIRLQETAPAWPKGFDAFRSFRIRWGTGDEGVALTFERHAARFKRVHGDKAWRWELLLSAPTPYNGKMVKRLRLLGDKNASHVPVVEWITTDLQAHRNRTSVEAVRSEKSLADEGIVLGWLFPKRVEGIDYKKWCAWYCAGYELNVPEHDGSPWCDVPCVCRDTGDDTRCLYARWHGNDDSGYSVPPLG